MPINKLNEPLEWCLGQHHGPHGRRGLSVQFLQLFCYPIVWVHKFQTQKDQEAAFCGSWVSVSYNFVSMQMYALHTVLHWPDFGLTLVWCWKIDDDRTADRVCQLSQESGVRGTEESGSSGLRLEDGGPTTLTFRSPNNALLTLMENLRVTNIKNAIVRKQDEPLRMMMAPIWSHTVRSYLIRLRGGENCQLSVGFSYRSYDRYANDCLEMPSSQKFLCDQEREVQASKIS